MHTRNVLLAPLLVFLHGCQPEAPAPKVAVPADTASPAPQSSAMEIPAISEANAMRLVQKSGCLACHALDKKMIGPSFKDVSAKYRGDSGAETRLADVIVKGSQGVWGVMAMPPSPQVGEADRRILAKFILSLK